MKVQVLHSYSDNSIVTTNSGSLHPNPTIPEIYNEAAIDVPHSPLPDGVKQRRSKQLRNRAKDICRQTFQKKNLERTFPLLRWLPEYTWTKLISDFIAGLTVGLTVLPQALAYATVAGLPPIYGLYSGFVGPFVYILFGSTKVITIVVSFALCILTFPTARPVFTHGRSPEYAVFLCFTSAIVQLLIAFFRLGFITNFISFPVISAFTSAVALTIVSTQIKALVGINFDGEGFFPVLKGLVANITNIQKWDSILSLTCCVSILILMNIQWIVKRCVNVSPGVDKFLWVLATSRNAIAIGTCTVIAACIPASSEPFSLVGNLTPGLPQFKPPPFSIKQNVTDPFTNVTTVVTHSFQDLLREEAAAIFIMPLLGLMGHITIAKAFAGAKRVDGTQEVLAIGVSGLISSFFSSMPIAGSFSRTTVNAFSGAESPLGGLLTGTMVICALQFLTPYFYFIPKSSLASVVCTSVIFMVDFNILRPMWRSKKPDLLPWSLTFFTTLFVGLEYGITVGLGISAIFLLYYAARPRVKVLKGVTTLGTEFILVELDRSLTYPSVDYVTDNISKSAHRWGDNTTPIVVDCHHIQFVDFTAAKALCDMIEHFHKGSYKTIFWKLKPSVLRVMQGIMQNSNTPFVHCRPEYEMEALVDSSKLSRSEE